MKIVYGFLIGVVASVILFIGFRSSPQIDTVFTSYELNPDRILELVNDYRSSNGLSILKESPSVCRIAETRLTEVKKNWSHDGFFAKRFCSVKCKLGENLARFFKTEEETFGGWRISPKHNEVMLIPDYKYGCIATDGEYTVFTASDIEVVR